MLYFTNIIQSYKNLYFLPDYGATEEEDLINEIWAKFAKRVLLSVRFVFNERVPDHISWCKSQMNVSVL